jgi:Xylanase inhibitor C-terminal
MCSLTELSASRRDRVATRGVGAEIPVFAMSSEVGMVAAVGAMHPDGILGLKGGRGSWIDAMVKTGMPDELAIHECDVNGTLWLGGAPTGSATFVAATAEYAVALHAIDMGSARVELPPDTAAVVDSGLAGLVVPPATFDAITAVLDQDMVFSAWFGSAAKWFDDEVCVPMVVPELLDWLPPITIELDGLTVTIPAKQAYAMPAGEQVCPTLAARGSYVALGDVMMRSATVIFDRARHRIGFAAATPCNHVD